MTGRLLHYRSEPLEFEPARTYVHRESWTYGKPDGFWVSVEGQDDWPAWCRSEEFRLGSLRHVYEVNLDPDAKILRLTNPWITVLGDDWAEGMWRTMPCGKAQEGK